MKKNLLLIFAGLMALSACHKEEMNSTMTLQTPGNVRYVSGGETEMTFAWDAVEGAELYTARLVTTEDGKAVGHYNVAETQYTFEGLEAGTSYSFVVRSVAGKYYSAFSEPLVVVAGGGVVEPEPDPDPVEPLEGYEKFLMPESEEDGIARAFPGAEGGGMYTTGGRGGRVIHVTNLNDSGEGSLRAAVEASGARTIVFDVAGRINLSSELRIRNGNLTIAGQTAPGDGICISGQTVMVDADNVIIRFMRFRLGYDGNPNADGEDAIWGRYHQNIVLDHCSMSWSVDEVASFYANKNFTMQWCMLSEALRNSGHSKGGHGYGGIWGGRNASFHHNLLAHNDSRNARIDHPGIYIQDDMDYRSTHRGNVDYRNNVIYNWGDNSTYGGEDGHFNIVGNYYKPGPASKARKYFVDAYWYNTSSKIGTAYPELYLSDNYYDGGIDDKYPDGVYWHDQGDNPSHELLQAPLSIKKDDADVCSVTTHSAQSAYDIVSRYAGASFARDAVDERVARNVLAGDYSSEGSNGSTGGLIDNQSDVGGWPVYDASDEELAAVRDSDGDGMSDAFEAEFGLDPENASDGALKSLDRNGRYTNLEMYLHWLVKDIVAAQTEGGTYTALD